MIYVVQPGDTLWKLSQETGISVEEIAWLNQIPDPDVLIPGQALVLLAFSPIASAVPAFTGEMKSDIGLSSAINSISIVCSIVIIVSLLMVLL